MTTTVDYPTDFSAKLFGYADSFDVDGLLTMLSDDVAVRFGNAPLGVGKDAVREALGHLMPSIAAMHHKVLNEWRIDDWIIHQLDVTYKRHDGNEVIIPATTIYRLREELITEYLNYADLAPLFA